jgi:hypothetical protein
MLTPVNHLLTWILTRVQMYNAQSSPFLHFDSLALT